MTDYRGILNKVGMALITVGLADLGFMIYSVSRGESYSSSFNVFAVIAGIFLMRGSLRACRLVVWFAAFMLAGFLGAAFFLFPFAQPVDLYVAEVKLYPASAVATSLIALVAVTLLGWVYRQLRSAPVLDALKASGRSAAAPKLAFGLGFALVAFLGTMLNMTLNGAAGARAVELARKQLGPDYSYTPKSIEWAGGHNRAVVAAYTDKEVRYVSVEWAE